jgi:hypothetical protein
VLLDEGVSPWAAATHFRQACLNMAVVCAHSDGDGDGAAREATVFRGGFVGACSCLLLLLVVGGQGVWGSIET